MGEAGLEACVDFLVGGVSACPPVTGAGSWPSGKQGCVKGVSRGGCGLKKSLGILSADGWGCVPALLVVWPEASQH